MPATTVPTPSSDPSRSGAVWVAATGACLLVLAAAIFVAVRWDQIPDGVKLGAVLTLTGGFLLAGRALRPRLPATAGVMFHLGAFLVPIDVAAIAVDFGVGWPGLLLAEGLTGLVVFPLLCRWEPSGALRLAVAVAGLVFAAGLAGTTADAHPLPHLSLGLVLTAAATFALVGGCRRLAVVWATAGGLTPLLGAAGGTAVGSDEVLAALGVIPAPFALAAAIAGLVAGAVLALEARRRDDTGLVYLALLVTTVGVGSSWLTLDPGPDPSMVALAALFVLVEVVAHHARHDRFWAGPATALALVAEVLAIPAIVVAAGLVLVAPLDLSDLTALPRVSGAVAVALGLTAVGWLAADLRRRRDDSSPLGLTLLLGGGWAPATIAAALTAVGAAAAGGGSVAAAVAMVVVAGGAVVSGRDGALVVAIGLGTWAPISALAHDAWVATGVGAAAALIVAEAGAIRSRLGDVDPRLLDTAWVSCFGAIAPAIGAAAGVAVATDDLTFGVLAFVVAAWATAIVAERGGRTAAAEGLGLPGRAAAMSVLWWGPALGSEVTALVAGALTLLLLADTVRTGDRRIAFGTAATVPVLVAAATIQTGFEVPFAGLALCLAAVVAAGLAVLLPPRWQLCALAVVVTSTAAGLLLAAGDAAALAPSLILVGGLIIGAGLVTRSFTIGATGGLVVVLGAWLQLTVAEVTVLDAYVAPVAVLLVGLGYAVRIGPDREQTGSWVAYGPAIALLGGTALIERVAGGSGWHALVAGAVGVAAVAVGGARRLGAPLLLGTALLGATAGYESLVLTQGIPTWAWLALGGSVLLASGIAMERHEVGPVETGRRLVDVIHDRYS